jgi:hypothetical protein
MLVEPVGDGAFGLGNLLVKQAQLGAQWSCTGLVWTGVLRRLRAC